MINEGFQKNVQPSQQILLVGLLHGKEEAWIERETIVSSLQILRFIKQE